MIVLLASFSAGTDGYLQLPIVIVCAAAGAIIGDNLGYYIGRTGGRTFIARFGRYFFLKPQHLTKAEAFFNRHGAKTVFFGRFFSLLRIWAAILAGMYHMPWHTFLIYNALGGIVWACLISLLGYLAGHVFHQHFEEVALLVKTIGWGGLAIVVVIGAGTLIVYRRRQAKLP
jgi:membrane protein DedA with SNARE-associated domain